MSKDSQLSASSGSKGLAVAVVLLIIMTFVANQLITGLENQEFRERYSEIETGMRESTVVTLLGSENDRSTEFYRGQSEGFEEVHDRAAQSGAAYYLMWYREADVVYVVGFNQDGYVAGVEASGL